MEYSEMIELRMREDNKERRDQEPQVKAAIQERSHIPFFKIARNEEKGNGRMIWQSSEESRVWSQEEILTRKRQATEIHPR